MLGGSGWKYYLQNKITHKADPQDFPLFLAHFALEICTQWVHGWCKWVHQNTSQNASSTKIGLLSSIENTSYTFKEQRTPISRGSLLFEIVSKL
jgi:hypothetical protein